VVVLIEQMMMVTDVDIEILLTAAERSLAQQSGVSKFIQTVINPRQG
jgi:hypothetical protein